MSSQILVIEYEPRYTDRIREAVGGIGVGAKYTKDGDEALSVLQSETPSLIILSSVIPRYGTADLVRRIRSSPGNQKTPILLTMSGYTGATPGADAAKFGANDILPKPYTSSDLGSKVRAILGIPQTPSAAPPMETAETVRISRDELLAGIPEAPKGMAPKSSARTAGDDLDKILADTLSGVRMPGRKKAQEKPPAAPTTEEKKETPRRKTSGDDLDQLLHDTLSGLEKTVRFKTPAQPAEAPIKVEPPVPAGPVVPEPAVGDAAARPVPPPPEPEPFPERSPFEEDEEPFAEEPGLTTLHPAAREDLKPRSDRVEPVDLDIDGERFGQYILVEKIATGGMAEVWKARMRGVEGFEKIVAIKKILPHLSDNQEFVDMFIDEAKLAAQLNHNNIIHIYDLGKIGEYFYIAMEYIEGHDLKSILRRAQEFAEPMPVQLALSIAAKLAGALDYAHRRRGFDDQELGIVHRDVSPQNVLISYEGDIKLCDFGIAKAATKASHTQAGALKGKLQYMSPEQAWGRPIDRRSDIFSVSSVLFEMLAGRKLFAGESELSILDQVREANVVAPSTYNDEIGHEVDAIVLRGLEKDPAARYQTAGQMAKEIESVLYNFRPAPTSADVAIYMNRLFEPGLEPPVASATLIEAPAPPPPKAEPVVRPAMEPPARAPLRDRTPGAHAVAEPAPVPDRTVAIPTPASVETWTETDEVPRTGPAKSKMPLIAAAVIALAIIGAAIGWFMVGRSGDSQQAPATTPAPAPVRPGGASTQPIVDQAAPITPESEAATGEAELGADDLAMIDEEVRKRLDEERRRLEAQNQPTAATQPPAAPASPQVEPRVVEQTPAPKAEPAAAEEKIQPPGEQPAEKAAPPPAPVAPAPEPKKPTVNEGDLVQQGTPGLIDPELISMKKVGYPPIAKRQGVEGIVIVRALVSETGRVIEAEVLRGVPQNVGINEAAQEMVMGATFKPATMNGVKVKAYKTVPIPFKL